MSLECTLDVAPTAGRVGFAFTVENDGSDPVDLKFSSAQTHDVAVFSGGEEVWRWSDGQMFAQMMQSETLDAGASVTYEAAWEGDGQEPGEYEAVAELATRNVDCEAREQFRL